MKKYVLALFCLGLIAFYSCDSPSQTEIGTVTSDGAWCWFSDPRAIYVHGENPGVLTGWVTEDGSIEVAKISAKGVASQIVAQNLDKDDHANPAFVEITDEQNMVFYTKHFDDVVRYHKSSNDVGKLFDSLVRFDPFDEGELEKFPLRRTTYANPFYLKDERKIYCFGRWTGFKPNMMVSNDGGKTFSKSRVLITNYPFDGENRPYVKYYSNGHSKIHIVFTDGHPRNEPQNSVYYAYYEKGAFWRIDGTKICEIEELPFEPKDATIVYQADSIKGKSWVFDIASDKQDNPVILYTCYPDDLNHICYYSHYAVGKWEHIRISNTGEWFSQTPEGEVEREPNYSGGMTIHPLQTNKIYVSEKINEVFEIVEYTIGENDTPHRKAITANSNCDNVRPFVPRNMRDEDSFMLLWMENERYVHYTDYKTSIKYYTNK